MSGRYHPPADEYLCFLHDTFNDHKARCRVADLDDALNYRSGIPGGPIPEGVVVWCDVPRDHPLSLFRIEIGGPPWSGRNT